MKITYDPDADAMRISFQEGAYDMSEEVGDGVVVDVTKEGKVIAIELLDVSEKMPQESVENITIGMPKKAVVS